MTLSKKQKMGIAFVAILLMGILAGANTLLQHAKTGRAESAALQSTSAHPHEQSADMEESDAYMIHDAQTMCAQFAPKALQAYVTSGNQRSVLLQRYFTPDAQGLTVAVNEIAKQPLDTFTGFWNVSSEDSAVCSVATGTEAPWTMTFEWTDADGWKCSAVSGGMRGAYREHNGPAPKAVQK